MGRRMGNKFSFLAAVGPFTGGGTQDDGLSFPSNVYYHQIPLYAVGTPLGSRSAFQGRKIFGFIFSARVPPYENKST
jgi:hypothetical protein